MSPAGRGWEGQPIIDAPKYRADIDGLRAVAVLTVVVFHAFPSYAPGGFIGVDVFFVISGYLISRLILESLGKGTFSLAEFYGRRIRRIAPALLLVLIATYVFGAFVLFEDEYRQLGKHIAAGAGFLSNIVLWFETGYFDTAAETKPLLHLWSLGIEEQFYLLWPLVILVAWKSRIALLIAIVLLVASSFLLSAVGVLSDPVATFYSPQTRFWELLAGSALAWVSLRSAAIPDLTTRNALPLLGALLLAVGVMQLSSATPFPGAWALMPVLGAVAIISAGPDAWLNRVVLSHPVLVWIGLISFPLYLWHWPLLSFLNIAEFGAPSRAARVAAVVAAIALAWLTYILVERPVRFGKHGRVKLVALSLLTLGMLGVGYISYRGGVGLDFNGGEKQAFLSPFENSYPAWRYFREKNVKNDWRSECGFFDREKYMVNGTLEGGTANSRPVAKLSADCYTRDPRFAKAVLIWGDSHAQALSAGISRNMPRSWQVLQVASSGCRPNPKAVAPSTVSQCDHTNFFALKTIEQTKPDVVVVAHATDHSVASMEEIAAKLSSLGAKRVLFVGPAPIWLTALPKVIARRLWETKPQRTLVGLNLDRFASNEALLRDFKNSEFAELVDIIDVLCNADGCLTRLGDDLAGTITTWDTEHLTLPASDYLANKLLIKKIIGRQRSSDFDTIARDP